MIELLLLLIYFSPLVIFGVKLGYLIKFLLSAVLLVYFLLKKVPIKKDYVVLVSLLILGLIPTFKIENLEDVLTFILNLIFFVFFFGTNRLSSLATLDRIVVTYSILTTLVFLKILPSLGLNYSLEVWNISSSMFSGIMERPQITSFFSSVVVFYALNRLKGAVFNSVIGMKWFGIILINTYFVYTSFVRIGWLILFLIIVNYVWKNRRSKTAGVFVLLGIIVLYGFIDLKAVYNRVFELTSYSKNVNITGNGRIDFWKGYITIFNHVGLLDKIFGTGQETSLRLMVSQFSLKYEPHNLYISLLTFYGLYGLLLYTLLLRAGGFMKGFAGVLFFLWFCFQGTLGLEVFLASRILLNSTDYEGLSH